MKMLQKSALSGFNFFQYTGASLFLGLFLLSVTSACGGREPGPNESENGETIYWRLSEQMEISWNECTDGIDRDGVQPPPFEENSFIIYKLSEDGSQAVAQACETTSPSSCEDHDLGISFEVSDNSLIWESDLDSREENGCTVKMEQFWEITDDGEIGLFEASIITTFSGDENACSDLDQRIAARGTNSFGLDGCVMTLSVELEYYPTDFPIIRAVSGQR